MATEPSDNLYLFGRDKEESSRYWLISLHPVQKTDTDKLSPVSFRLDDQHRSLIKLSNSNTIHTSIPKDHICSVADIALGVLSYIN